MTNMEAVKARYPKAFSAEWQGVWRVYKDDLVYESRLIFLGCDSEEQAWEDARELVEHQIQESTLYP